MRAEILTGPERRRRWSVEEKLSILADADEPGATVTAVATRRDVTRQQIYYWRSLRRKGLLGPPAPADIAFLPVGSIAASSPAPSTMAAAAPVPAVIEIAVAGGRVLKVPVATPTRDIKRLIRAVEGA